MEYYGDFALPSSLVTLENSHLHTLENNGATSAITIGNECWDMDISAAWGDPISEKKNKFVSTTINGTAVRGWGEITESYTYEGCTVTEKIYDFLRSNLNHNPVYVRNGYLSGTDPSFSTNYSSIVWTPWKLIGTLNGSAYKLTATPTSKSSVVQSGTLTVDVFKHANKYADVRIHGEILLNKKVTLVSGGWDTQISVTFGSNSEINNLFKNVSVPNVAITVLGGDKTTAYRLLNAPLSGSNGIGFGGIQVAKIADGSTYEIGTDCPIFFEKTMTIPL